MTYKEQGIITEQSNFYINGLLPKAMLTLVSMKLLKVVFHISWRANPILLRDPFKAGNVLRKSKTLVKIVNIE